MELIDLYITSISQNAWNMIVNKYKLNKNK